MPSRWARSTMASGPTLASACAYTVFTELAVASASVRVPQSWPPALDTVHGPPSTSRVLSAGAPYNSPAPLPASQLDATLTCLNVVAGWRPEPPDQPPGSARLVESGRG